MQRLVILAAALVVACAKPTPAEMAKRDQDAYAKYTRDVAAIGAALGAARFEPEREWRTPVGREPPSTEGLVTHAGLPFRIENGRVGHSLTIATDCSGEAVQPTYFYARRGAGVVVVVVEADVHIERVHRKGSCGMMGCGTAPPPPAEQLAWLPVGELGAVTVEKRTLRLDRTRITCDDPRYPP